MPTVGPWCRSSERRRRARRGPGRGAGRGGRRRSRGRDRATAAVRRRVPGDLVVRRRRAAAHPPARTQGERTHGRHADRGRPAAGRGRRGRPGARRGGHGRRRARRARRARLAWSGVDGRRPGRRRDDRPQDPARRRVRRRPPGPRGPVRRRRSPASTASTAASVPDLHGGDQVAQLRASARRRRRAAPGVRARVPVARPAPAGRGGRPRHGRPRRLPQRQPRRRARRAARRPRLGARPPRRSARGPRLAVRARLALRGRAPGGRVRTVDELVGAYEAASGEVVDRAALHWWEVLGTLKWGVICVLQAFTHLSGMVRSVELAAIGRRVCEVEHDLLLVLPGGDEPRAAPAPAPRARAPTVAPWRPRCTMHRRRPSSSRPCASSSRTT